MKGLSDLAKSKQDAELTLAKQRKEDREQSRKKYVPIAALVIANLIFISLDVRGFDVVLKLTQSVLLAIATVIVSGVLALFWWDVLYPHSRRHDNHPQVILSLTGVALGVILSAVLAFLDYLVDGASFSPTFLWGCVVFLTGAQGVMLGWWWLIDKSIESDAKREKSLATRISLQETADDFKAEIESMESLSKKLEELQVKFPGKGKAAQAARAMGFPVLAEMLEDADGDGIPNYKDRDYKPAMRQQPAMASDTSTVKVDTSPNASSGQKPPRNQD